MLESLIIDELLEREHSRDRLRIQPHAQRPLPRQPLPEVPLREIGDRWSNDDDDRDDDWVNGVIYVDM